MVEEPLKQNGRTPCLTQSLCSLILRKICTILFSVTDKQVTAEQRNRSATHQTNLVLFSEELMCRRNGNACNGMLTQTVGSQHSGDTNN